MKLTKEDTHNLYDVLVISVDNDTFEDLKLNKLDKWFSSFFKRLEEEAIPEIKKPLDRGGESETNNG